MALAGLLLVLVGVLVLVVLLGLGVIGNGAPNARQDDGDGALTAQARRVAPPDQRADIAEAVNQWNAGAAAFVKGYAGVQSGADIDRWLDESRAGLLRMSASVGTLNREMSAEGDAEVKAALRPLIASYERQTNLAIKLREDIAQERPIGERRTRELLRVAIARHAQIAVDSQRKLETID